MANKRRIIVYSAEVFAHRAMHGEGRNRLRDMKFYVWNADMLQRILACVDAASETDLKTMRSWQMKWTSAAANIISDYEEA